MSQIQYFFKNVIFKAGLWCVDGRNDPEATEKGPQLLGGSILPVLLAVIFRGLAWTEDDIKSVTSELKVAGFELGVHRDNHAHEPNCGCGFGDQLVKILQTALNHKTEFEQIVLGLIKKEKLFSNYSGAEIQQAMNLFWEKLSQFLIGNIEVTGEALIDLFEDQEAKVVNLVGKHEEQECLVNLVENTTLDIAAMHEQGVQVFNLDAWILPKYAEVLGLDVLFAYLGSLFLYLATHEVLVVQGRGTKLDVVVVK